MPPWRAPQVKSSQCKQLCSRPSKSKYARSIKDPASYGLCNRDYDSHHKGRAWPGGTEYQYAYSSNYTPASETYHQKRQQEQRFQCLESYMHQQPQQPEQQPGYFCPACCQHWNICPCSEQPGQEVASKCVPQPQNHQQGSLGWPRLCHDRGEPCGQRSKFELYDTAPQALLDKHYRGAHYTPGAPLGTQVPEELTRLRKSGEGSREGCTSISCEEDVSSYYLPNYRYRDWVARPEHEVWRDCNTDAVIARLPDAPTEHYDFYNEVRMGRPARRMPTPDYRICRVIPVPMDKDIDVLREPYHDQCSYGHLGGFREATAYQRSSTCRC